jgi:hypothetical protein
VFGWRAKDAPIRTSSRSTTTGRSPPRASSTLGGGSERRGGRRRRRRGPALDLAMRQRRPGPAATKTGDYLVDPGGRRRRSGCRRIVGQLGAGRGCHTGTLLLQAVPSRGYLNWGLVNFLIAWWSVSALRFEAPLRCPHADARVSDPRPILPRSRPINSADASVDTLAVCGHVRSAGDFPLTGLVG